MYLGHVWRLFGGQGASGCLDRWALRHLSDAPEMTPLTRLEDFIQQPGLPPSEEVLVYCVPAHAEVRL